MKRIAALNDLSGMGRCSLSVALPIISACGAECCPLPTAVLTRQTGFESYSCLDLTDKMKRFCDDWKSESFDGIYTGFFSDPAQAEVALDFIKQHSESECVLVDPVLGDCGEPYSVYSDGLYESVVRLVGAATAITPNLTELAMLTGKSYNDLIMMTSAELYETCRSLMSDRLKTIFVTGIPSGDKLNNLVCTESGFTVASSKRYSGSFSGTGDMFSSVCVSELVKGRGAEEAAQKAARFICKSVGESIKEGLDPRYGTAFQKYLGMLCD